MNGHKIYLYPKWLRIWHGINALAIIVLIATGISMQYTSLEYTFIQFDKAILFHNLFGVIAGLNYLLFLVANLFTENGKAYRVKLSGLVNRLFIQSKYYMFGYFKGEQKPFPISKENKFNPLQRVVYVGAMYMLVPAVIITGFALLFPEIVIEKFLKASGIQITAVLHSAIGFLLSLFLIIHLYIASVGKSPLKNYRSIVNGYHED